MKKIFALPIEWTERGSVQIVADTLEEAVKYFLENERSIGYPYDAEVSSTMRIYKSNEGDCVYSICKHLRNMATVDTEGELLEEADIDLY